MNNSLAVKSSYFINTEDTKKLNDSFFNVPCKELAKALLGKVLVRKIGNKILKGKIVETECYLGGEDKASHSYNGKVTERNTPMYMKPGTIYVYMTYGMYYCFNISSQGDGAAVLIRALEPLEGENLMIENRNIKNSNRKRKNLTIDVEPLVEKKKMKQDLKIHEVCNGPAKLCISLNIDISCNKMDLCNWDQMWCEKFHSECEEKFEIISCPRIGIDSAGIEWASKPLRFYIFENRYVSKRNKQYEKDILYYNDSRVM